MPFSLEEVTHLIQLAVVSNLDSASSCDEVRSLSDRVVVATHRFDETELHKCAVEYHEYLYGF